MKEAAPCEREKMTMPGTPSMRSRTKVLRAPKMSHIGPEITRIKIVPVTARLPARTSSERTRAIPPSSRERR